VQEALATLIAPLERPLATEGHHPFIIMLAGVNGAGKTTSIGKLAKYFQAQARACCLRPVTRSAPRRANSSSSGANATRLR